MTTARSVCVAGLMLAVCWGCAERTKAPLDGDTVGGLRWGMPHDSAKARMMQVPGISFVGDSAVNNLPYSWGYYVPDSVTVTRNLPGPTWVQRYSGGLYLGRAAEFWFLGFDDSSRLRVLEVQGTSELPYRREFERFVDELRLLYGMPNVRRGFFSHATDARKDFAPALFAYFLTRGWLDSVDRFAYEASTSHANLWVRADEERDSGSGWHVSYADRGWKDGVETVWRSDTQANKNRRRTMHISQIDTAAMRPVVR